MGTGARWGGCAVVPIWYPFPIWYPPNSSIWYPIIDRVQAPGQDWVARNNIIESPKWNSSLLDILHCSFAHLIWKCIELKGSCYHMAGNKKSISVSLLLNSCYSLWSNYSSYSAEVITPVANFIQTTCFLSTVVTKHSARFKAVS